MKDQKLKTVFAWIQQNSDYKILYNDNVVPDNQLLTLTVKDATIDEVMGKVLANTGLSYTILPNNLIVVKLAQPKEAATIIVKGKVTDEKGQPVADVSVMEKGTSKGVRTDENGEFSISVENTKATLQILHTGYETQDIALDGRTSISIKLREKKTDLEEIVVIGYGTSKKKDLTGAIVNVDAKKFETQSTSNFTDMLRGSAPGINVTPSTSAKGGFSDKGFEVRGTKSVGTSQTPLIVLDGMIYTGDIADINTSDIQSMDILKDASSAAVYGARATNGVIIITTKKGSGTKPTITYRGSVGISTIGIAEHPRGPEGYLRMREDYNSGAPVAGKPNYYTNPSRLPDSVSLAQWRGYGNTGTDDEIWLARNNFNSEEIANYKAGKTINWFDEVYKPGFRTNQDIGISGRSDKVSYYASLGYEDNTGMVVGDRFKVFRARVNLDVKVTDWLTFGTNTQFANRNESALSANSDNIRYVSPYGSMYDTTQPKYSDGSYPYKLYPHNDNNAPNPLLGIDPRQSKQYINNNLLSNLYAELKLPFNIKYRINWVNRIANLQNYTFTTSALPAGLPSGKGVREDSKTWYWNVDNIISWEKTFANIHRVDVTLLYSAEKTQDWLSHMDASGFAPSQVLGYDALQYGAVVKINTDDKVSSGDAAMARVNYGLLDRYLFTLSVRRDGYSAFGINNPRATYPAAAFAWRISNEKFFKSNVINELKLRLSWGQNGNREIGQYAALAKFNASKYIYDGTTYIGVTNSAMANNNLKWENTAAYNGGINFGLFQNRIVGAIDVYYMKTTDMLMNQSLPRTIGYSSVIANLGQVDNKGIEVTLNTVNMVKKDFKWTSSFGFSMNRNKVVHLYGNMVDVKDASGKVIGQREGDDPKNGWYIGHALDQIYDIKTNGIWQVEEKDSAAKYGCKPGDFKLVDANHDWKITNPDDKVWMGYTKPRFRLSWGNEMTYKQFSLSFLFTSNLGYYGANNEHLHSGDYAYMLGRGNDFDHPYWTPENRNNEWARLGSVTNPGFSYWVNRSFVRLQNLSLGYEIPQGLLEKVKVQRCQVYFNMQNTLTLTKWDNWDPETGSATPMLFTWGVNLTL